MSSNLDFSGLFLSISFNTTVAHMVNPIRQTHNIPVPSHTQVTDLALPLTAQFVAQLS